MEVDYRDRQLIETDPDIWTHQLIQFYNCRILRDHQLKNEDFWVENNVVANPESIFFDDRRMADIRVNCNGLLIAPGMIDTQFNGGFGVDFSSQNPAQFEQNLNFVAKKLLAYGITSFCPTMITCQPSVYHQIVPLIKRRNGSAHGAGIIGAHLEGPFISIDKRGAHPIQNIQTDWTRFGSTSRAIADVYGEDMARTTAIVTLAPELNGAIDAIKELVDRNVRVSIGHSKGALSDGETAIHAGATCITHLFNAMESYHHRDPGLIGLLTSKYVPADRVFYGIIADGIHTHDSALRIAHRTHPDGLILVTDAVVAFGMGDGLHKLGDQTIRVDGMHAFVADSNITAGSVASMPLCVRRLMKAAQCGAVEALESASTRPARLLGIDDHKGTLKFGADADFVIVDDSINIKATFIAGRLVYAAERN